MNSVSVWYTTFYGGMKPLWLKAVDSRLREAEAHPFERQFVGPPRPVSIRQKTLVVLLFIMPPRKDDKGKGKLPLERWRILWSVTESRSLLTSRDGLSSRFTRLVIRASLLAWGTTVRSYPTLAGPVAWNRDDMDFVGPSGLVAEGLKPDSGCRGWRRGPVR